MMSKRPKLAAPFALMGLMGGWLTGQLTIGNESEVHLLILLTVCTPMSAALLGNWLSHRAHKPRLPRTLITLLATVVAGALNGALIGLFAGAMPGMAIGLVCGLMFSLPFIPGNLLVMAAAHRVGRAPDGSIVDGADRRGVWRSTALVVAMGSLLTLSGHISWRAELACALALLAAAAIFAADVMQRHKLGRIAGMLPRFRQHDPAHQPQRIGAAGTIELGLGDERFEEIAVAESPYREADRVVRVVVGDPVRSSGALRGALVYDVVAMGMIGSALMLQLVIEYALTPFTSCG